jgi:N-acylneuraminate cytidylyltransferase
MTKKNLKILGVIPARQGSELKDKNIKNYKGKPLIFHTINTALNSKFINKIVISTDSIKYKKLCMNKFKNKIEIPFIRPKSISGKFSKDYDWIKHCLLFLKNKERYVPDVIVHLRPTTPNRNVKIIDKAISFFLRNLHKATSLRSASEFSQPPEKMFKITKGYFKGYFKNKKLVEYYNLPRQKFVKPYLPNGYIDILKPNIVFNSNLLHGNKILPFITNQTNDIDELDDFKK